MGLSCLVSALLTLPFSFRLMVQPSDCPSFACPGGPVGWLMRWPSGPYLAAPWPPASSSLVLPLINLSPLGAAVQWLVAAGRASHPQAPVPVWRCLVLGRCCWDEGDAGWLQLGSEPPVHGRMLLWRCSGRGSQLRQSSAFKPAAARAWVAFCSTWRWPCRCFTPGLFQARQGSLFNGWNLGGKHWPGKALLAIGWLLLLAVCRSDGCGVGMVSQMEALALHGPFVHCDCGSSG